MRRSPMLLALTALLASCSDDPIDQASTVAIVGDRSSAVAAATNQGLVAFDADGQIEPALAERWIVSDDGLHFVFRLAQTNWINGKPVLASEVAHSLNENFSRAAQGRLGHLFSAVADVDAMTSRIIDIRLKAPRPNMLQLLAAPEMGIHYNGYGTGPYSAVKNAKDLVTLRPLRATDGSDDGVTDAQLRAREIKLRGEGAALAITHYQRAQVQAVLGGSFGTYPLVQSAQIPAAQIVVDHPQGLFGLAFVGHGRLIGDANIREALSMAIDRSVLPKLLGVPGLAVRNTILPDALDQASDPAAPDWAGYPIDVRRSEASKRIRDWSAQTKGEANIKVAILDEPGARLLFARLAADWRTIGVRAQAVRLHTPSDLVLVDEVAPNASVNWYFTRLSCEANVTCNENEQNALAEARAAPTLDARAQAYSAADKAYNSYVPFIPLANPIRWNLTSVQLVGLRPSAAALHPLIRLRSAKN